jgi:hypothetical protein
MMTLQPEAPQINGAGHSGSGSEVMGQRKRRLTATLRHRSSALFRRQLAVGTSVAPCVPFGNTGREEKWH